MATDNSKPTEPTEGEQNPVDETVASPVVDIPVDETPEPVVEEVPEPIIEPAIETDSAEDTVPADGAHDTEPKENPELYTVQAADLNAYPELSQQGVQLYDQVPYGSLYVWKNATATGDSVVQDLWPRSTGNEKPKGLTFNGEQ